jgi:hypothetical protein
LEAPQQRRADEAGVAGDEGARIGVHRRLITVPTKYHATPEDDTMSTI